MSLITIKVDWLNILLLDSSAETILLKFFLDSRNEECV